MMKRSIIVIIGVLAAIGTASVLIFPIGEEKKDAEPIKLSINPFPGTDFAFIAQEKGFFEKNGVNVKLVLNPEYSKTVELFTDGDVDGAFEVYTDVIIQNTNGIGTKVVYVMDYSTDGDVIISGVDNFTELKGKKFGVVGIQSFSHYFVVKALENAGLDQFDVFYENVDETNIIRALDDGIIQAGHTWEPTKSLALKKGYTILAEAGDTPGVIVDVVVFNPQIVVERPDDVQAIIKSLVEARNFIDSDRDEALKIMGTIEGITPDEMKTLLNDAHRPTLEENKEILGKPESPRSVYNIGTDIVNFYLEGGAINILPDLNEIIEPKFVNNL